MQSEPGQDDYTICRDIFGTYEVLIKFATGEERRRGRFATKASAMAWMGEYHPSLTPATGAMGNATAGSLSARQIGRKEPSLGA